MHVELERGIGRDEALHVLVDRHAFGAGCHGSRPLVERVELGMLETAVVGGAAVRPIEKLVEIFRVGIVGAPRLVPGLDEPLLGFLAQFGPFRNLDCHADADGREVKSRESCDGSVAYLKTRGLPSGMSRHPSSFRSI
jgi:hypothetical protein